VGCLDERWMRDGAGSVGVRCWVFAVLFVPKTVCFYACVGDVNCE
jgi:hypothetical protein